MQIHRAAQGGAEAMRLTRRLFPQALVMKNIGVFHDDKPL